MKLQINDISTHWLTCNVQGIKIYKRYNLYDTQHASLKINMYLIKQICKYLVKYGYKIKLV